MKWIAIAVVLMTGSIWGMPIGLRTAIWNVASANNRATIEDLLPESCDETELPTVLGVLADASLLAHVVNEQEYTSFRNWVIDTNARVETLLGAQTTWSSFAMDTSAIMPEPKAGDLVIDSISALGSDGEIEIIFSLADVEVGASAIESRLKSVFGVEGAKSLSGNEFTSENFTASLIPTEDGRIKALIKPTDSERTSFFFKVNMK
ncbi:MAG: hypothetical protein J6Q84_02110 [Kiritimatiellae bacterium]|nr:hypothetical protein [Kiritimatiellia bacterium]